MPAEATAHGARRRNAVRLLLLGLLSLGWLAMRCIVGAATSQPSPGV